MKTERETERETETETETKTKTENGFTYKKNGWKYISIKGKPKERGYAYGFACANEFIEIQKMLKFFMYESYGRTWDFFIEKISADFK